MITKNQREYLINHIVDNVTKYLIEDNNIKLSDALIIVYRSRIYELLQNINGELYIQSPAYIYELLKEEIRAA